MDDIIKNFTINFIEEENGELRLTFFGCLLLVFGAISFLNFILDKGSEMIESNLQTNVK